MSGFDGELKRKLRRPSGNLIAEFGPILFSFLLFIVFPIINLAGIGTGMATMMLVTNQIATRAANQGNYDTALSTMSAEANNLLDSGFTKFAKLKPVGGYQNSGADLYVICENYRAGTQLPPVGPNLPLTGPIDSSTYVYEMQVKTTYDVGPVISLASVPFIGNIAGLGKPARISFSSARSVEHPAGLDNGGNQNSTNSASVTPFNRVPVNTQTAVFSGTDQSGWNYPQIYQAIQAAGKQIVAENVLVVRATDNWVDTGLTCGPGETVWVDSRANGQWQLNNLPQMDANGAPGGTPAALAVDTLDKDATIGSLIGCVGTPPVVPSGSGGISSQQFFAVGNTLTNFPVTGSGEISMQINDNYCHNTDGLGLQTVRVIITR